MLPFLLFDKKCLVISCLSTIPKVSDILFVRTFERLYNAVKENRPYSNGTHVNCFYFKEIYNEASYHRLFKDGKIEWHSDDLPYNEASVLTISKEEGCFKVEFKKCTDEWATHCVYFL